MDEKFFAFFVNGWKIDTTYFIYRYILNDSSWDNDDQSLLSLYLYMEIIQQKGLFETLGQLYLESEVAQTCENGLLAEMFVSMQHDSWHLIRKTVISLLDDMYRLSIENNIDSEESSSWYQLLLWASSLNGDKSKDYANELKLSKSDEAFELLNKLSDLKYSVEYAFVLTTLMEGFYLWGDDNSLRHKKYDDAVAGEIIMQASSLVDPFFPDVDN
jgi:Cdc6-like AAA superfamily ATPase